MRVKPNRERRIESMNVPSPQQVSGGQALYRSQNENIDPTQMLSLIYRRSNGSFHETSAVEPENSRMDSLMAQTASLKIGTLPLDASDSSFKALCAAGQCLRAHGRYEHALKFFREALRLKNRTIDKEPDYIQTMFADLLFQVGIIQANDPSKSIPAFIHCLHVRRAVLKPEHPAISHTLYHLASAYYSAGMASEALDNLMQALVYGSDFEDEPLFHIWVAIGTVQQSLGYVEDSSSSFEEAWNVLWRIRKRYAKDLTRNMSVLMLKQGNSCQSPEELNEAISFFHSLSCCTEAYTSDGTVTASAA